MSETETRPIDQAERVLENVIRNTGAGSMTQAVAGIGLAFCELVRAVIDEATPEQVRVEVRSHDSRHGDINEAPRTFLRTDRTEAHS